PPALKEPNFPSLDHGCCSILSCPLCLNHRPNVMNSNTAAIKISRDQLLKLQFPHLLCVRKRPLIEEEVTAKESDIITIAEGGVITVQDPNPKFSNKGNRSFCYDHTFDKTTSNDTLHNVTTRPLVQAIFEQGIACCLSYSESSSGKTFTMAGNQPGETQDYSNGLYGLTARDIVYLNLQLEVYASFFEVYCEKVLDLLNNNNELQARKDRCHHVDVAGLHEIKAACTGDVLKLIKLGQKFRTTCLTLVNKRSSRSHAVFQLILRRQEELHGKLSLVDLVGCERATSARVDRQISLERTEINKNLLALRECVRALGKGKFHITFRDSKLTHIFEDFFTGSGQHHSPK
uniref:Kinesin motor domain-containing protein n=1 Tax=Anabas testudineus TaxID=64144 RepID=A0A3Q1HU48_ANATE